MSLNRNIFIFDFSTIEANSVKELEFIPFLQLKNKDLFQ